MNPRVIAWARVHGIDPALLVREDPEADLFRVDGHLWTILFMQWIQAKWREWRALCPHPGSLTCADHCFNHEAFDAWLARSEDTCLES